MPLLLTSQEKKVLGFVAIMVVLGLAMLCFKRWGEPDVQPFGSKGPDAPAAAKKTP